MYIIAIRVLFTVRLRKKIGCRVGLQAEGVASRAVRRLQHGIYIAACLLPFHNQKIHICQQTFQALLFLHHYVLYWGGGNTV